MIDEFALRLSSQGEFCNIAIKSVTQNSLKSSYKPEDTALFPVRAVLYVLYLENTF